MKNEPIVIEQTFSVTVEHVWDAISQKEQMKHWYFDVKDFKPEVGFEFSFEGGKEDVKYVHLCKITEIDTMRKLAYTWRYAGYEGNSLVTFELFEEGGSTRLRLTHSGLETFPETNPDLAGENFVQGWTYIIKTSLNDYLKGVYSVSQ